MSTPLGTEPAFPSITSPMDPRVCGGLSKREWLAGTIAAGIMAQPTRSRAPSAVANIAVDAADALLIALDKGKQP